MTAGRNGNVPRDIAPLYPDYFTEILATSGTPVTPPNVAMLVGGTALMIGTQAASYAAKLRNPGAFEAFVQAFGRGGRPERRMYQVDDMVDMLWAWDTRCQADLRTRFSKWRQGLLAPESALTRAEIPPLWADVEHPDREAIWRFTYRKHLDELG